MWQVTSYVVDASQDLLKLLFILRNWEVCNVCDFFSGLHDFISLDRLTKYFQFIHHEITFIHSEIEIMLFPFLENQPKVVKMFLV